MRAYLIPALKRIEPKMRKTTKAEIKHTLESLEIPQGSTVIIHSSLIKFGAIEGGAKGVFDVIQEVLGADATIVMPSFSFDFSETEKWHRDTTKSKMGALTEYFRKLQNVYRTIHPFHSVCVIGKHQTLFKKCNNLSSFGPGSPFELLMDLDALNLAIGTEYVGGSTFLHHVEEISQVPYRTYKTFPGKVYDNDNNELTDKYKMYVRIITDEYEYDNDWEKIFGDLENVASIKNHKLHGANFYLVNIREVSAAFQEKILSNPFYPSKVNHKNN
jgi:aminoglycoside 3-N-acetyltransferase